MNKSDRVRVIGPNLPEQTATINRTVKIIKPVVSAQLNKVGTVVDVAMNVIAVLLDGEERPRNFTIDNLQKE